MVKSGNMSWIHSSRSPDNLCRQHLLLLVTTSPRKLPIDCFHCVAETVKIPESFEIYIQHVTMMQALWSRAAQTRSCRCRSCLHVATTVARRATTAATKRRVRVSDVFTACYSTILATAAVADAKVKEDRRRDWDTAIAEAKGTTPRPDSITSHANIDAISGEARDKGLTILGQSAPEVGIYRPMWDARGSQSTGTNFENRLKALGQEIRQSSEGLYDEKYQEHDAQADAQKLREASAMEWIDEEPDDILVERDPKKPIHLERRELSCANMVENLLAKLVGSVQRRVEGLSSHQAHPELKDIVLRIQTLRSGFTTLPTYEWEDLSIIERERRQLHRLLYEICGEASPDDTSSLELMIAKICYSLLVCSTPISMVTYNILIRELDRLHQYDLAEVAINSYLYDSRFKPNHNSLRIILDHYVGKNDIEGWREIKNRMRVTRGRDMRIKRRRKNELDVPPIQDWVFSLGQWDMKTSKRYLHQRAPRDTNVIDASTRAALKFVGPRNAVMHIRQALQNGHKLYSNTLCAVMEEFLARRDEGGTTSLLQKILSLWDEGADTSAIVFTKSVRGLIYQLLHMIGVDTSLGSKIKPPNQLPLDKVQAMLRQFRIFSIEDDIGRTEDFVTTIEDHLEDIYHSRAKVHDTLQESEPSLTPDLLQTGAVPAKDLDSLGWFADQERLRTEELRKNIANSRWSRLELLEAKIDKSMKKVEALRCQTLPFAFKVMPTYLQQRYLDITSSSMVYHRREQRPSQYEELLRVRREGVMGVLTYVEKQVTFSENVLHKIEAEVFSTKESVFMIPYEDVGAYLERASTQLIASEQKAAWLEQRICKVRRCKEMLLLNGGQVSEKKNNSVESGTFDIEVNSQNKIARYEMVSKQLWKLEREAERLEYHLRNLHHMWENFSNRFRGGLIDTLTALLEVSDNILHRYEGQIFWLSPIELQRALPTLPRTQAKENAVPRAAEMIVKSAKNVQDLAIEVYELCLQRQAAGEEQVPSGLTALGVERPHLEEMISNRRARILELSAEVKSQEAFLFGLNKIGLKKMVAQSGERARRLEIQIAHFHRSIQARKRKSQAAEEFGRLRAGGTKQRIIREMRNTAGSVQAELKGKSEKEEISPPKVSVARLCKNDAIPRMQPPTGGQDNNNSHPSVPLISPIQSGFRVVLTETPTSVNSKTPLTAVVASVAG
jgi:hypothetical protein